MLRRDLGLDGPYRDPGVAEFGLENVVYAVGDTFLEVVAPTREGTTAGRYLERMGRDGGYMAIFQVPDVSAARRRAADLGIRVVWQADLPDIAGTHLHPKDVGGAIVSLDQPVPEVSWRWAGPHWTGGAPDHPAGGLVEVAVATAAPDELAGRWASVLGVEADGDVLLLDGGTQRIVFTPSGAEDGIVGVTAHVDGSAGPRRATIGATTVAITG